MSAMVYQIAGNLIACSRASGWQPRGLFLQRTATIAENVSKSRVRYVEKRKQFLYHYWRMPKISLTLRHWEEGPKDFSMYCSTSCVIITLRPRQNGLHFAGDILKCIFLNENVWISIKMSRRFVPKCPIGSGPALVHIMAWRRTGDKPLSEPMMAKFTDAYMRQSASMGSFWDWHTFTYVYICIYVYRWYCYLASSNSYMITQ